jgi:thiol-disulfide isomerase/thioredoxin
MFSHSLGGGPPSMLKTIYSKLSWSLLIYVILGILFILIIIYFYNKSVTTTTDTDTYKINRENMHNKGGNKAELMLFYVDWCPHCKTAKPEWENLKSDNEGKTINGYKIIFTEYNCTNETAEVQELINKFKIEGYPTIKLIKDNQVIEYDAKPTKATMEQFLNTVL